MRRDPNQLLYLAILLISTALLPSLLWAQSLPKTPSNPADPLGQVLSLSPLTMPTLSPGELELVKLEGEFADSVAKGGGKAFASWFAEDAVTLQNGKAPVRGHAAIAAAAVWDPKEYQLTWYAEGAQMGPEGTTGFTWGHYTSTAKDGNGQPVVLGGRYITFWKKVSGAWKVAMEASADDVPAGDCCALPKP
jgi:ketosteroid isomerase-like protein